MYILRQVYYQSCIQKLKLYHAIKTNSPYRRLKRMEEQRLTTGILAANKQLQTWCFVKLL